LPSRAASTPISKKNVALIGSSVIARSVGSKNAIMLTEYQAVSRTAYTIPTSGFERYTNVSITSGKISHISLVEFRSAEALMARNDTTRRRAVSIADPSSAVRCAGMRFDLFDDRSQMLVMSITTIAAIAISQYGKRSRLANITRASGIAAINLNRITPFSM